MSVFDPNYCSKEDMNRPTLVTDQLVDARLRELGVDKNVQTS
jgi:hypothetical protein